MKKGYIKLLYAEIILILVSIVNLFYNKLAINNIYSMVLWLLIFVFLILTLGFEKNKALFRLDAMQIVFIYSIMYIIFIYLLGLIVGFVKNPYNLSFISILKNVIPFIIIVVLQELTRYEMLCKGKSKKIHIFIIVLVFIFFDISINIRSYNLNSLLEVYKFIGELLLPSIATNLMLTFISYKTGYKAPIIYRLILGIYPFIVPILPNTGIYINSILSLILPMFIFVRINSLIMKVDINLLRPYKVKISLLSVFIIILFGSIYILNFGLLKYKTMAIGSNSMYPKIKVGDVVVIEKLKENFELQIGDIVAFEYNDKIVVHRVTRAYSVNDEICIRTKGDNNTEEDLNETCGDNIIGVVKFTIPKIGYPAVWMSELKSN